MLKERKAQFKDPTSHLPEEETTCTSGPAESIVEEPESHEKKKQ